MKIKCIPCVLSGVLIGIGILYGIYFYTTKDRPEPINNVKNASILMSELILTSSAFEHNGKIPSKYTCDSENVSPPLEIGGVDEKARSLVLIMDDPDIPKGINEENVWDHWVVYNIPTDTTGVPEGAEPKGVLGVGTGGKLGYQGPCPPDREHRYIFILYALDTTLEVPEGATKDVVRSAMQGHILQKAELIGLYERQNR